MPDRDAAEATTIRQNAARRAIAAEVRAEVARQGKTLRELAPILNLTHQTLSQRLRGEVAFRGEELVLLATALGVPAEQFLKIPSVAAADAA
jgi:transcriptional regulator with XRE-family HTH domain